MAKAIRFSTSVLGFSIAITFFSTNLAAAPLEKVNASYGAISGSMLPIWVAKEARLFEKHGLDLNLVYISGGPRSIMSLIGGSVQFVNHSGMPALEAYQRGADTAMIASPMNQLEHSLVVQKNITSVEQLRGKILGMSTSGSLTDILLREGLRLNGVSEKDVTIIPAGDLGARLSGLQTGRIHGAIIAGVQTLPPPEWDLSSSSTIPNYPLKFPDRVFLFDEATSTNTRKPLSNS